MYLAKETIFNIISENFNIISEKISEPKFYEHRDQLSLLIDRKDLIDIMQILKDNEQTQFDQLTDVTAIDWLEKEPRFELVYFLYSTTLKHKLRVKVALFEEDLICPTLTSLWKSANWYERETYDMYGIKFSNHPNLRRFYMPEDYNDPETGEPLYPLRKDFPVMGIPDSLPLPPYPEKYGDIIE